MHKIEPARFAAFVIYSSYCGAFYALPFIFYLTLGTPLEKEFVWRPSYELGIVFAAFSVYFFWLLCKFNVPILILSRRNFKLNYLRKIYVFLFFILSTIFLLVSVSIYDDVGINFRHSGQELNSLGGKGFLHLLLNEFLFVYVVSAISYINAVKNSAVHIFFLKMSGLVCFVGFTITLQTAMGFIYCLASIQLVFTRHKDFGFTPIQVGRLLKEAGFVSVFILLPMVLLGSANKYEGGITYFLGTFSGAFDVISYLLERFSYRLGFHFYSLSELVTNSYLDLEKQILAISEQAKLILYRASLLTGGSYERPELGSVARINFVSMNGGYADRTGTTPSLLGSLFFLPGGILMFPIFMYACYSVVYRTAIVAMTHNTGSLGILYSIVIISAILDSLLDTLNPFSSGFVSIVALVLFAHFVKRNRRES